MAAPPPTMIGLQTPGGTERNAFKFEDPSLWTTFSAREDLLPNVRQGDEDGGELLAPIDVDNDRGSVLSENTIGFDDIEPRDNSLSTVEVPAEMLQFEIPDGLNTPPPETAGVADLRQKSSSSVNVRRGSTFDAMPDLKEVLEDMPELLDQKDVEVDRQKNIQIAIDAANEARRERNLEAVAAHEATEKLRRENIAMVVRVQEEARLAAEEELRKKLALENKERGENVERVQKLRAHALAEILAEKESADKREAAEREERIRLAVSLLDQEMDNELMAKKEEGRKSRKEEAQARSLAIQTAQQLRETALKEHESSEKKNAQIEGKMRRMSIQRAVAAQDHALSEAKIENSKIDAMERKERAKNIEEVIRLQEQTQADIIKEQEKDRAASERRRWMSVAQVWADVSLEQKRRCGSGEVTAKEEQTRKRLGGQIGLQIGLVSTEAARDGPLSPARMLEVAKSKSPPKSHRDAKISNEIKPFGFKIYNAGFEDVPKQTAEIKTRGQLLKEAQSADRSKVVAFFFFFFVCCAACPFKPLHSFD
uniref:Uncharacterized protein n=2 Tax=Lotharella globosa TaxID=91324 RepID=A0A7S3YYL5_9EUKA